ncbi:MAG: FAD-dependent oxidoreductase [Thermoanaerobaculia bacterium]
MIRRQPDEAATDCYDLVIVGGGVYGIALLLEASRRGLKPLLLEQGDFGSETSWNSLRIVHGGLRYLQSLDLSRFFESVAERRWFLQHFPDLVRPLSCMMPLYGKGLKRPSIFRLALATNSLLSSRRNQGVSRVGHLPAGGVLSVAETLERFPMAAKDDLEGAALWYDAAMPDSQRLLIEMLHWACTCGATALNYVQAVGYERSADAVATISAIDRTTNRELTFRAPLVVNAAGPWCREVSSAFDRDIPELFHYSLAFNVVLDREPLADAGLAVSPRSRAGRTYFLVPWKGRIMAGTFHAPWNGPREDAEVTGETLATFLDDLNDSIPGLDVAPPDVERVHWGLLPAAKSNSDNLASRPMILHHGDHGGPEGLFSVSGVKFTTARLVAEQTLKAVQRFRDLGLPELASTPRPEATQWPTLDDVIEGQAGTNDALRSRFEELAKFESAITTEDILLRRTDWYLYSDLKEVLSFRGQTHIFDRDVR